VLVICAARCGILDGKDHTDIRLVQSVLLPMPPKELQRAESCGVNATHQDSDGRLILVSQLSHPNGRKGAGQQ